MQVVSSYAKQTAPRIDGERNALLRKWLPSHGVSGAIQSTVQRRLSEAVKRRQGNGYSVSVCMAAQLTYALV